MNTVKVALTERRKMQCDIYVYPDDIYDIPGLKDFEDIKTLEDYAFHKLEQYAGRDADVYINGGLSQEIIALLCVTARLGMTVRMLHYDRQQHCYLPQTVRWKMTEKEPVKEHAVWMLCDDRHGSIPGKPIFDVVEQEKVFDFAWQEQQARQVLSEGKGKHLDIYITGLKSLCISVLNVIYDLGASVTFYHYNYDTESYFPQEIDS